MDDRDWARLVEQIRNGDCTPFLGADACSPTLPTGVDLSRTWAARYDYPFGNESDLHEVMQYVTIFEIDPVTVKQRLSRDLSAMGDPDYTARDEPHTLLAGQPIAVYMTTNYDDFMTRALERAQKQPVTVSCPWYRGAESDPETRLDATEVPSPERPLVFHLHGSFGADASLVIAEQDHLDLLISVGRDVRTGGQRVIPPQVLSAITRRPLLFLGYSLRDWSFRTLLDGLAVAIPEIRRRRHVCVQRGPSGDDRRARDYLERYAERWNMATYWGSTADFCRELAARLESF